VSGFSRTDAFASVPSGPPPGSAAGNVASFVLCPPPPRVVANPGIRHRGMHRRSLFERKDRA